MSDYVLSPLAKADIEDIWDYTAANWNAGQAEKYIRQIQSAIEALAVDPLMAHSCETIRAGYRKYPAGSHVIFIRVTPDAIDVVRILHSRMDFERHI
jgi:toxin ParE1/3/4